MATSQKRRAQGGGRTPNSEPRQQVFKQFDGCNFELSSKDFRLTASSPREEQSDLQMNYLVIQNNAEVSSNKTIETRLPLSTLLSTSDQSQGSSTSTGNFTGVCILIDRYLFMAQTDGNIKVKDVYAGTIWDVQLVNNAGITNYQWKDFEYIDGKLVGLTQGQKTVNGNQVTVQNLWIGDLPASPGSGSHICQLENASTVSRPPAPNDSTYGIELKRKGNLAISESGPTDTYPYRVAIQYSYITKFGPTEVSDTRVFYANMPVNEWYSGAFLQLRGSINPSLKDKVLAVEIYYTTDNRSTFNFAGRCDFTRSVWYNGNTARTPGLWVFNWYGDLDSTYAYPVANLLPPDQNYTEGVHATHMTSIDGRMYFWGDKDHPYRLWIGGNVGNLFSVSPGTGGGFVDVEPNTRQEIRVVTKYKTQSGNSIVTMLCDSPNSSKEQRFNLVENTISLSNEQSMKSWQAEQVSGSVGCKSYNGAVVCEDGLYAISRYGLALTTLTMEYNSQIRTTYVSDAIKPAFVNLAGQTLKNSSLIELDGVLYLAFGTKPVNATPSDSNLRVLDNLVFCYDIDLKTWWTITLDVDVPILNMIKIDYEGQAEGIGFVTAGNVYLLKTTHTDYSSKGQVNNIILQTGELSTTQPQQAWQYLSQIEFRFDYFIGNINIELSGIDQFGREIYVKKNINHSSTVYDLAEYMRVDLRLQSYQLRITGSASFRLTHFISKLYVMSSKQGLVWGFDDQQSFRSTGDIHPTFKDYNSIKKAIIP